MADDQGGPAGWAAGVLLSVTGVPREQRSLVQQLIEAAGGRYSPNLSRRCTHLALPSGEAGAPPTAPSEKLLSGLRNRSKWGLHIVDLRWLLDSARAEGRLDEARFPARLPPGAAAAASHGQEQAPPGSAAAPRPAPSGSKASVMSGGMSLQAADTYQRGSPFCVATMAAAAARAQRPTDPLRNSVTSRPLSSFRQPGTSLQTQSPSVKRSVRWAHPAGTPEGSTAGVAAPSGAVAAAHAAAAAGMLPGEVEQAALRNEDEGRGINFVQLPMTQAGFLPADDLLQLLWACAVAPQQAATRQASPSSPQQLQQQNQQQASWQHPPAAAAAMATPAAAAADPAAAAEPAAAAGGGGAADLGPLHCARPQQVGPSCGSAGGHQQAAIKPAMPLTAAEQQRSAPSTADILQHMQPAAAATPLLPPSRTGLPTAALLEQLRASNAGSSLPQWAGHTALQQGPHGMLQAQQQRSAGSTDGFLAQLRASSAGQQQLQQQHGDVQAVAAAHQAGLDTSVLLEQLRACAPQVQQQERQQRRPAASTDDLLAQLQASAHEQQAQQQQERRAAASTDDLLAQLRAAEAGQHAGKQQQQMPQAGRRSGLDTATLLEQLRMSAEAAPRTQPLPAVQAGVQQQKLSSAALLEQLRAAGPSAHAAAAAPAVHQHPAAPPASPAAGQAELAVLLQQLQKPAPVAQEPERAGQQAAPTEALATQLRGLSWQQPATESPAHAKAEQGRSAEELARLLQQQRPRSQAAAGTCLAAPPAAAPGQQPSVAAAAAPGSTGSTTADLLHKLRELQTVAPPAAGAPPLRHAAPAAQPQQQAQQLQACATPPSEDAELPPAKYARQEEPQGSLADGSASSSLAPTEEVPGSGDTTAVATPSSSAGSPPAAGSTAKAAAAAAAAAHAGERSPELATLASQVGNSSGRVFAGMVVVLDAGLPPEEQQQVRAALEQGGGRVAEEGGLCRGATHVVCQPDAALKWLSMGVGIVSPQWVHRSLRSGRQQRCLAVSADTSRHLPAASAATSPSQQQTGSGSTRSSGDGRPPLSSELLQSREARLLALSQLAGGTTGAAADAARPAARSGGGAAHQPATTPSELLGGVAWCVLEPPAAAVLEGSQLRQPPVPAEEDVVIVPDSEDEDQADGGGLCCVSASQAAVQDLLLESPAAGSGSGGAHPQAAAWQASAVLPGVATLTLLLPRDARGELGLDTRCITLPLPPSPGNAAGAAGASAQRQMTAGAMLQLVHDHYSESLGNQEQLQLLQTFPAADSAAAVLRPAFLELQELRRGALLGPRTAFEGLRKATREPTGTVYEVLLGC